MDTILTNEIELIIVTAVNDNLNGFALEVRNFAACCIFSMPHTIDFTGHSSFSY